MKKIIFLLIFILVGCSEKSTKELIDGNVADISVLKATMLKASIVMVLTDNGKNIIIGEDQKSGDTAIYVADDHQYFIVSNKYNAPLNNSKKSFLIKIERITPKKNFNHKNKNLYNELDEEEKTDPETKMVYKSLVLFKIICEEYEAEKTVCITY